MVKTISLKEAQARKFKRHDDHFNKLMAQKTETTVTYQDNNLIVDYSKIQLVNKMVYVAATFISTNTKCFMVIE